MEPTGFGPPDLTHPAEWLAAGGLALQGGAWAVMALAGLGLVLAALAWSMRQGDDLNPLAGRIGDYTNLLALLPRLGFAAAMVVGAVAATGTLAKRAHHWEQNQRAEKLAAYPDMKMVQLAPVFGRSETVTWTTTEIRDKKPVEVKQSRVDWYTHHLAGTDVKATIGRKPDPVDARKERFDVGFDGSWQVVSPLATAARFYVDLAGPADAGIVRDLAVAVDGKPVSPESEGASRYWFDLPANGRGTVRLTYHAEGVPRWVYDTQGAKLKAFKLVIAHDVPGAKFASGVAPTAQAGNTLTWDYPTNAAISEPLGLFTAAGDLGMAGILPRWLLLAPALLAAWLGVLALTVRPTLRAMALAGVLFAAAVLVMAAGGRLLPPVWPWLLAGLGAAFLASALAPERPRDAQLATLFGLVAPGAALALAHAGPALAVAGAALAGWLLRQPAEELV